ncbi:hypothetical protein G6F18_013067 [Rhizopus arrhizus]|nr:hypothetical protein G6F18_013067 [Rhizopus arrhizus]
MDIANITNPTSTTTTLTSEPDFHFGPATAPTASALSLNGPLDFGILPGMPDWFQPIMAMITLGEKIGTTFSKTSFHAAYTVTPKTVPMFCNSVFHCHWCYCCLHTICHVIPHLKATVA